MDKTCSTCKHWHEQPKTADLLGQPARGECREGPPAMTQLPQTSGGRLLALASFTAYPQPQADTPACSRHAARTPLNGES